MKKQFSKNSYPFYFCLALVLILLGARSLYGIDPTDEMQYYGQIIGLSRTNQLFSNDLFIQQLIYAITYPAFKIHLLVFGETGLVLFGRIFFSLFLLTLFLYSNKKFLAFGAPPWQAGLSAAALTFSPPYHNIYAISYNTGSQIGWAIFLIWFWEWKNRSPWQWAILIVLTGLAHPISGLSMAALLCTRTAISGTKANIIKTIATTTSIAIIAMAYLLIYTTPYKIIDSIQFSSAFGIGSPITSSPDFLCTTFIFLSAILLSEFVSGKFCFTYPAHFLALAMSLCGLFYFGSISWIPGETPWNIFTNLVKFGLFLTVVFYCFMTRTPELKNATTWTGITILTHFATLTITSSNGLLQGLGTVLLALPILNGLRFQNTPPSFESTPFRLGIQSISIKLLSVVPLIFALTHWTNYPYRDTSWYKANTPLEAIPAFEYIFASQEHAFAINAYRSHFLSDPPPSNLLISGNFPALYFALGIQPSTCMFFLHSLPSETSSAIFRRCIDEKKIDGTLQISKNIADFDASLPGSGKLISDFSHASRLTKCSTSEIPTADGDPVKTINMIRQFRLCKAENGRPVD